MSFVISNTHDDEKTAYGRRRCLQDAFQVRFHWDVSAPKSLAHKGRRPPGFFQTVSPYRRKTAAAGRRWESEFSSPAFIKKNLQFLLGGFRFARHSAGRCWHGIETCPFSIDNHYKGVTTDTNSRWSVLRKRYAAARNPDCEWKIALITSKSECWLPAVRDQLANKSRGAGIS